MRFAYADPPYIGQSKRHYGDHPDYDGEVDHEALIGRLVAEYPDGWALSASSPSLRYILSLCPEDVRVMAWTKTNFTFYPSARLAHAWEPVILRLPLRDPSAPVVRDWTCSSRAERSADGTKGSKPQAFCFWLFDALGIQPGDTLDDLFPGSGAVTDYLTVWRNQLRIEDPASLLRHGHYRDRTGQEKIA